MVISVEHTPKPTSSLPDCVQEMYSQIDDPYQFHLPLVAGECMLNILKAKQEDTKIDLMDKTCHYHEVSAKHVYGVLKGDKYSHQTAVKRQVKQEQAMPPPPVKKR